MLDVAALRPEEVQDLLLEARGLAERAGARARHQATKHFEEWIKENSVPKKIKQLYRWTAATPAKIIEEDTWSERLGRHCPGPLARVDKKRWEWRDRWCLYKGAFPQLIDDLRALRAETRERGAQLP